MDKSRARGLRNFLLLTLVVTALCRPAEDGGPIPAPKELRTLFENRSSSGEKTREANGLYPQHGIGSSGSSSSSSSSSSSFHCSVNPWERFDCQSSTWSVSSEEALYKYCQMAGCCYDGSTGEKYPRCYYSKETPQQAAYYYGNYMQGLAGSSSSSSSSSSKDHFSSSADTNTTVSPLSVKTSSTSSSSASSSSSSSSPSSVSKGKHKRNVKHTHKKHPKKESGKADSHASKRISTTSALTSTFPVTPVLTDPAASGTTTASGGSYGYSSVTGLAYPSSASSVLEGTRTQGSQGAQGSQVTQGTQGSQRTQGSQGTLGYQGTQGTKRSPVTRSPHGLKVPAGHKEDTLFSRYIGTQLEQLPRRDKVEVKQQIMKILTDAFLKELDAGN